MLGYNTLTPEKPQHTYN